MGLGKTLSMISLLASDFARREHCISMPRPTLLVVPLSLLPVWESELRTHLLPMTLSWFRYYGPKRLETADKVLNHDVVLTTYDTVAMEWQKLDKRISPLFTTEWHRVILDEGKRAPCIESPSDLAQPMKYVLVIAGGQRRPSLSKASAGG